MILWSFDVQFGFSEVSVLASLVCSFMRQRLYININVASETGGRLQMRLPPLHREFPLLSNQVSWTQVIPPHDKFH